ncbi:MAG: hypothetical protein KDA24_22170 [Deltaproteobacteria bacterium]|nr:hypothetical protein [Deltaproteobacteria bacterium]
MPDGDRLVRDRGSLSRRLSTPASPVPRPTSDVVEQLPAAPSWKMPGRQSAPLHLPEQVKVGMTDEDPTDDHPVPLAKELDTASGRDFMVRGRPQGELYASEHSLPPEDPLLADLVAGRVSKSPKFTDEFALSADWDKPQGSRPGEVVPRRQKASRSVPRRSQSEASRPQSEMRIVPPGPQGRSVSRSGVRDALSNLTDPDGRLGGPSGRPRTNPGARPRTNSGARHPLTNPGSAAPSGSGPARRSQPGTKRPNRSSVRSLTSPESRAPVPSEYDFRGIEDVDFAPSASVQRTSLPVGSGARAPGVARQRPRTTPGNAPPPPKESLTGREIGGRVAVGVVSIFAILTLVNGFGVYRAKSAITQTLSNGIGPNGPTADLPRSLEQTLVELDILDQIEERYSEIDGEGNTYRIGVELRSPVGGYPVRWKAVRTGDYAVASQIRTLEVFVAAGWTLDSAAKSNLDEYEKDRALKLEREREGAKESQRWLIAGDDDDSAGSDDSAQPADAGSPTP